MLKESETFIADEQTASFKNIGLRKDVTAHYPILSFRLVMKMPGTYLTVHFGICCNFKFRLK